MNAIHTSTSTLEKFRGVLDLYMLSSLSVQVLDSNFWDLSIRVDIQAQIVLSDLEVQRVRILLEEENGVDPDVRQHCRICHLVVNRSEIVSPLQQSLLKCGPARGYRVFRLCQSLICQWNLSQVDCARRTAPIIEHKEISSILSIIDTKPAVNQSNYDHPQFDSRSFS